MRFIGLLTLLLLPAISAPAQQQAHIKKAAQLLVQATLAGDFQTAVKYTYPRVVTATGGPVKMLKIMKSGAEQLKSRGAAILQAEVGEPGPVLVSGKEYFSVVPERLVMQVNRSTLSAGSSLLAISTDKGKHWYFMDAGMLKQEQLKQWFPKAYNKLVIPKPIMPILLNN